jgi:hypothetical protein
MADLMVHLGLLESTSLALGVRYGRRLGPQPGLTASYLTPASRVDTALPRSCKRISDVVVCGVEGRSV